MLKLPIKSTFGWLVREVRNLLTRDGGASMVEYALLLALITAVVLVAAAVLGTKISSFFVSMAGSI